MKIYIAGKVTGLDHQEAIEKFAATEKKLTEAGVPAENIFNPMKFGIHPKTEWHVAMAVCIPELEKCTAVYIQRDWRDSFGARKEITRAHELKMDTYWEEMNDIALISNLISAGV